MNSQTNNTHQSVLDTLQSKMYASFSIHSNRIAITYGSQHFTYNDLDSASNRVCHWLVANKLSHGKHIALCLQDRSQLIIWMLGILKARSVFIPLDYHHPEGRVQQLLAIGEADIFITDQQGQQRLPLATLKVIAHEDIDFSSSKSEEILSEPIEVLGEDKVYIYFTSGSTGVPKAILGKNASLQHFINWEVETFGLDETSKVSQFISPGFDAFLRDVFPVLSVGGTVCIPDFEISNSAQLLHWIADNGINLIHCVPSFFKLLLTKELENVSLSELQYILMSGEKIVIKDLQTWFNAMGNQVQLVNLYGATETTMIKTYYLIQPEDVERSAIPIGKPISGTQVFLLDDHLRPVGKNSVGEIYIRTKYGTHGYYKNKELTAERFIKNPYGKEATDVLYKTGDLGRFDAAGNLEFLGRKDRQIKIRGIRVEPGEIEQHLTEHKSVKDALIKAFTTKGEEVFLCAYVITKSEVAETELKSYLVERLPAYLIPLHIVFLSSYPLLPNGKVDINSLSNPQEAFKGEVVEPANSTEEKMRILWAETLEREAEEISVDATFMDLGGHSLKMIFLVNKIKKEFGVVISLKELMAHTTIQSLSAYLSKQERKEHLAILPAADAQYYPLSPSQRRMYFLYEFDKDSVAYNMKQVVSLYGALDRKKLNDAFQQLVNRHESLRTTFRFVGDEVMQYISEKSAISINYIEQNDNLPDLINDFIKPFDLNNGPLFRVGVLSIKEDEHILIVDNHHILSDVISSEILLKDFMAFYSGIELSELQIHYKDYVAWQKNYQETVLPSQKDYWMSVFEDGVPTLELMTTHKRPSVRSNKGHELEIPLSSEKVQQLRALATKEGVTMYSLFLTIYNIFLSKLSNQEDIVVGTAVAGRPHIDLEEVVGLFVNTLALRNYPKGTLTFNDFLQKVHETTIEALENQMYPYEELIDALNVDRNVNRNPLFDVFFNYIHGNNNLTLENDDFKINEYELPFKGAKFDLTLNAAEFDNNIKLIFNYREDLYDESTIERFSTYLLKIIDAVILNASINLTEIVLLSSEEQQLLLNTFNNTTVDFSERTVLDLFKENVQASPENIALVMGDEQLTYQALDNRSDQWAAYLISKGLAKGDIVGLYMERSPAIITGMLAAMKIGAAYLPIDTKQPAARTVHMVSESETTILLSNVEKVPVELEEHCTIVDLANLDAHPVTTVECESPSSQDIAYILYTSGSTGSSKGCMITHKNLFNYISWSNDYYFEGLSEGNWGLMTAMVFDLSVTAIFTSLTRGKKLYLGSEQKDVIQLLEEMFTHPNIDTIKLTPTHITLLKNLSIEETNIKTVICGGEQLTKQHIQLLKELNQDIKIYNEYGPTEATVGCTVTEVSLDDEIITVGSAVANTQLYIVSNQDQLQPVGVQGELLIGGVQVAKGYLNRAALSSEKFIPNFFKGNDECQLYRTGDLAKWNNDGTITYLGRLDDQVKLNGVRIELGEIEYHLNEFAEVNNSAVLVQEIEGNQHLVAYYIATAEVSEDTLRNYLVESLPMNMVPSYYVQLDEFPTTSTGKLARKQLPKPSLSTENYIAPSNELETRLVEVWAELLNLEPTTISTTHSFFQLGGNSLKAMGLINRIRKDFSIKLLLRDIFQYQTIRSLGGMMEGLEKESSSAIPAAASADYYPLSSAQRRMYFLYEYNATSIAYNSVKVVKLLGALDKDRLQKSFQELIARHESLRTVFLLKDEFPVQRVLEKVDFAIDDLGRVSDIETAISNFASPFDLEKAPLLRVAILELSAEEHLLLVDNHHIISDGVTNGLLLKDFMAIYKGDELPALELQYKDYAVWQQTEEQQALLDQQKAFWLDVYSDDIPTLELPTDHVRPEIATNEGASLDFQLDAATTAALSALANEKQTTLFVVLHSIYTILLSKLGGEEDIIVGTSVAGRHHSDLEGIAGIFINALALRSKPEGNLSYTDYLSNLKDEVLASFENQEYPYEDLIDALKLKRDTSRPPLFNVMFEYFNTEQPILTIPGLELAPYEYEIGITRFDLTLRVLEETDTLTLSFQYATELFEKANIERFITYFQSVVSAILADTAAPIKEINILSEADQELLTTSYNATELPYDTTGSLLTAFAAQVAAHPNRKAIQYEGVALTYAELDARSNQLANYLRGMGIVPGNLVGLLLDRSLDMIVGVLGVLKSGAGYVPIDPTLPEQRVSYMLDQSRTSLLLAELAYMERFSAYLPVVHIKDATIWESSSEGFDPELTLDDLAYCIFTSGSSGKPKGVMMSHGSVLNLVKGLEHTVYSNYESGLHVSLLASYAFDASVQQIFGSLLLGHSLFVADDISRKDGLALLNFYNTNKIAVSDGTPTHLRMLMNGLQGGETLAHLKGWILAGEYLDKSLVKQFYGVFAEEIDMYNFYGPTETCVDSTYFKINPSELSKHTTIPIGKPLPNERVYVVDSHGNLVAKGVKGELCIAGAGLARCYVGNQEMTSERFATDWLAYEDRVYRTGDLVRWLSDGNLEYLGRIDDQVKLRGYRIELAEIEHHLNSISEITQSVVLLKEREGEEFLVGYYESPQEIEAGILRDRLSRNLPEYMLPSYYVHLEEMPVNLSGKIAKKELPDFDIATTKDYVAPSNEMEERMVVIWSEVLKLPADQIGVSSDFFELGGHSLKMVFLANKIKKAFEISVSLKELIKHSTIRSLCNHLLEQENESYVSIPVATPAAYYPLSSAQKRMYFLYEYNKQSIAYNALQVVKLVGKLDKEHLEACFQELVARHESLRTVFLLNDNTPVQKVLENVDFAIDDMGVVSDTPTAIANFMIPFDLSQAPLLRVGLIELSTEEHILLVDNHHIISDGVTSGLLLKDFMSIYKGENLPALSIQYKDYAVWQQSEEQQALLDQQKAFWLDVYSDDIPTLDLPTDHARPEVATNEGGLYDIRLDAATTANLTALAKEQQTTLFVVLHSMYTILLSKLSGEEDVVVGTSVAGRSHADLERVAGVFINGLALRSKPTGNLSYVDYLNTLKDEVLASFENQDYPYEDLIDALKLKRDTSRPPLFNVMFEYFNFEQPTLEIPGLELVPYTHEVGVSRFDLTLRVFEETDTLRLSIQYSTELFEKASIDRFSTYFQSLITSVLSDTSVALKDVTILTESDEELLKSYNATELSYDTTGSLLTAFAAQVKARPNQVAIDYEGVSLSYEELDARSNRLANYLQGMGIVPGNLVGLLLDRSLNMIVGILGVLKSGAGYVPIDPTLPEQRVSYMLDQSRASLLLSESAFMEQFSAYLPVLDIQDVRIWNSSAEAFDAGLMLDDLAYCIFTSGSSGKPKGVMMSHGSVLNLVKSLEQTVYHNYESGLRVCLLASYAFDASVQQIFGGLLLGHSLYVVDDVSRKDGLALLNFYNSNQIAVSDGTPTHLRMLLNALQGGEKLPYLKGWILAGEYLDKSLVSRFYEQFDAEIDMYNFYGPTETCVDSTYFKINPSELSKYATIPIGKPLSNERVYVTNQYGGLVAPGVLGELCIAGAGLGRCYVGNQEMTTERFVNNWVIGEERVYRTGDMVRWLPDGNLEYVGRIDDQVKLRGYRIELAEIEHHLNSVPEITQSVVLLKEREGEEFLVGYYESEQELEIGALRDSLSRNLPEYMLPSYYVHVEQMPVNLSGKIAKKELPEFDMSVTSNYEGPSNEMEESLVRIWSEVLKLTPDQIGVTANFFELGGHSLKMVFLANKIKQEHGIKVSLKELIEHATIRSLCNHLQGQSAEAHVSIPVAAPASYYPLSSAQRRMYYAYEYDKQSLAYNTPKVVRLKGQLDKAHLELCFQKLIARHENLRTIIVVQDGAPVQQILEKVDFAIDDIGSVSDITTAISNFTTPFDLAKAPLLRVGLIALSEEEHLLLINNHHIISDGVTNGLLLKEFMSIYQGDELPALQLQYKDYAVWQQAEEQQAVLKQQKEFWQNVYSDDIPVLDLPTDFPRPETNTNSGELINFHLDAETTAKLKSLAQSEQATLFIVIQSIYTIFLSKLSGNEDLIVGSPLAGRNHVDLENVAGMFVNTLALRNQPKGNLSYLEYLAKVKDNVIAAFENKEYPFEELLEVLDIKRDPSRPPLFNVMFSLMNFEQPTIEIPGLQLEAYDSEEVTTIADLILYAYENEDLLSLSFVYNSDLFNRPSIERFIEYFQRLVNSILSNVDTSLKDLKMLSDADQDLLINTYNASSVPYETQGSLLSAFAKQVAVHPDRVAVSYEGNSLSYAELDARSNQLANYLRSQKIDQGHFVGLLLDRSLDMIVGIFGVLKSGAAYVPIDPSLPEQRVSYMLNQTQSALLLTQTEYLERYATYLPVVSIGNASIWASSTDATELALTMNDVAYCIFTSGSSGKPKGVVMSHGSVFNLVKGLAHTVYHNYESGLRVALLASYAFDASVQQIFGGLLLGHSLYVTNDESRKDGSALLNFYNQYKIAVSDGTPTHLRMLLNGLQGGEELPHLKGWILAGEYLDKGLVARFYELFSADIAMYNFYGPTETCVDSTYFKINPSELSTYTTIPIGKPLPNERVYVANQYGELVAPGVKGELCIAGAGLGECYVGNEALTAERFASNWIVGEDRVYRTGDMVRWLPDGNLEYIGRIDDQVKLRGFRIELGEIANVFKGHGGLEDAVVLLNGDSQEDKRLTAYVVPSKEHAHTVTQLMHNSTTALESNVELYEMDNGVSMYFYNRSEAELLYTEIFKNKTYYKHGIKIPKNATILDIGANVGSFSIFSMITFENPKIYAFEPVAPIYDLLEKNVSLYKGDIKLFNVGISDKEEEAVFDYYPNATTLSGKHSEHYNVRQDVEQFVTNNHQGDSQKLAGNQMGELLEDRLIKEKHTCQLKALSHIISEEGIKHIDLLKIDAENVEQEVLNGITKEDWAKIDQVVIEVYDEDGRLDRIKQQLVGYGFNVSAYQSNELNGTKFYDVYCTREQEIVEGVIEENYGEQNWYGTNALLSSVRERLSEELPDYMIPSEIILIDQMPLTTNGKLDQSALRALEYKQSKKQDEPINETEKALVTIWSEVLKLAPEEIGVKTDFFELGGHSLNGIQIANTISKQFGVTLKLMEIFKKRTIRELAELIEMNKWLGEDKGAESTRTSKETVI